MVEHLVYTEAVGGSSPSSCTIFFVSQDTIFHVLTNKLYPVTNFFRFMKSVRFPLQMMMASAMVLLASCQTSFISSLKQPIDSDLDPLDFPGKKKTQEEKKKEAPKTIRFTAGQWLNTSIPNATFFKKYPQGTVTADQVLAIGTPVKVISSKESYVKVELESGEIGYIPGIMLKRESTSGVADPNGLNTLSNEVPLTSSSDSLTPLALPQLEGPLDPRSSTEIPGALPNVNDIPELPDPNNVTEVLPAPPKAATGSLDSIDQNLSIEYRASVRR